MSIILLITVLGNNYVSSQTNKFLYFEDSEFTEVKNAISQNEYSILKFVEELKDLSDYLLDKGPWTITESQRPDISTDPNNYISESPYWWPDPDNPEGPYIRKDGYRNPDRFMDHKNSLLQMYQSVVALSFSAYLFENEIYAKKALQIIDTWFLNKSTRMNPNMIFAQIIRNKDVKRGVGIIDTHRFTNMIEAFNVLNRSGYFPPEKLKELKKWFADYNNWMLNSDYGIDEKERGNNHSSWWAAQVIAISNFLNDEKNIPDLVEYVKHSLIDNQIDENHRQPLEEERTLSLNYSVFNVTALTEIASIVNNYDVDLFNYKNKNNSSLITTINYLMPFVSEPSEWKLKQIKPFTHLPIFLALAGIKQENTNYLELYKKILLNRNLKTNVEKADPFDFVISIFALNKLNHLVKLKEGQK